METIVAEFDGRAFVPVNPVQLPVGTRVAIQFPSPPRQPTEEDKRRWEELMRELNATEPQFATLDEAMDHIRGRPGKYP